MLCIVPKLVVMCYETVNVEKSISKHKYTNVAGAGAVCTTCINPICIYK